MIRLTWVPIHRARFADLPETHGKHMPLERALLIGMLEPDQLYGPAEVAAKGYERGTKDYERARKAFWNFARLNDIKLNFDNIEKAPGEPPQWYGSSWQEALGWRMNEVVKVMDNLKRIIPNNPGCSFFYHDNEIIPIYSPGEARAEESMLIMPLPYAVTRGEMISVRPIKRSPQKKKPKFRTKIFASSLTLVFIILGIVIYQSVKTDKHQDQKKVLQEGSSGAPVSVGPFGEAP